MTTVKQIVQKTTRTLPWKRMIQRNNYGAFIRGDYKPFDKSRVAYRDGDNT